MPTVEPVVSEEKLRVLLAEQHESELLDYKREADLADKHTLVELAKDVAAMAAEGGYLVIGADDRGVPTGLVQPGHAQLFDESRLRAKLRKWLPETLELRTAAHQIDGELVVLVYVGPCAAGFVILADDGRHGKDQSLVFRRGEVYVRHGTACEVWRQVDIDRIIARQVAAAREQWRAELAEELRRFGVASGAVRLMRGPASGLTWQLDAESFGSAVIELLRDDDDIPLRLLLGRVPAEAVRLVADGDLDELVTLVDRVTQLGATAVFLTRDEWFDLAVHALVAIYDAGVASPTEATRARLWFAVMARVFGLGGLVVRTRRGLLATLVRQQPHGLDARLYRNWIRHAFTQASRAELPGPGPDGTERHLSFIAAAHELTAVLDALRLDGASPDQVLDSVVQFDALAALLAGYAHRDQPDYRAYYPTFHLWFAPRVEPALRAVVEDPDVRAAIVGDATDAELAAMLRVLERPPDELWRVASWVGYESAELRAFLDRHPPVEAPPS